MTNMSEGAYVVEKDYKSERTHQDQVCGVILINEQEFFTASLDKSIKVWDKFSQGVSYTFETVEALYSLGRTGEHLEFMIVGHSDGNFLVYHMTGKNVMHEQVYAHEVEIIETVSLKAFKNKYFATRDAKGHVKIWSSNEHPDTVCTLFNFDADAEALAPLQPEPEPEPEPVKKTKIIQNDDGEDIEVTDNDDDDAEGEGDGEDDGPKKPVGPVREFAPVLVGAPVASVKDHMIEVQWKQRSVPSTCLLCITNYEEKFTLLGLIELKQRTRKIDKVFQNDERPTALFQAYDDILFVGTEKGMIEVLSLENDNCVKKIPAHESSEAGISVIQKLNAPGPLITRGQESAEGETCFLITGTFDRPEFKIWHWAPMKDCTLSPHI